MFDSAFSHLPTPSSMVTLNTNYLVITSKSGSYWMGGRQVELSTSLVPRPGSLACLEAR